MLLDKVWRGDFGKILTRIKTSIRLGGDATMRGEIRGDAVKPVQRQRIVEGLFAKLRKLWRCLRRSGLNPAALVQILKQRLAGILPIRLGQLLQFGIKSLGPRIVTGLGQNVEICAAELAQGLDVTGQQIIALVVAAVAPLFDPADHGVLILGQITHHAQVIIDQQKQRVVLIRPAHPTEKFTDVRLAKAPWLLPQIRLALVLRRIADLHRRHSRRIGFGNRFSPRRHFRQPFPGLLDGQQVLAANQAIDRPQIDCLHEVLALLRAIQYLPALGSAQLHLGKGHVERALARKDQRRTLFDGRALIFRDGFTLVQQRGDDAVEYAIFVQLATEAVDDVQPAVAQPAYAHWPRGQGIGQRQFGGRVVRSFHQAIGQGQQLHVGLPQRARAGRTDRGFGRRGSGEVGGMDLGHLHIPCLFETGNCECIQNLQQSDVSKFCVGCDQSGRGIRPKIQNPTEIT
ncbi:hypothetical protein PS684_05918 [Pseudomonas fluorescens]|nr:hypothetical protein PS684_05918 [Pseudomonas fluorescens]